MLKGMWGTRALSGALTLLAAALASCSDCNCAPPPVVVPDTTGPSVASTTPACRSATATTTGNIAIVFSEPMDASTLVAANLRVLGPGGTAVPGTITYSGVTATFDPADDLSPGTSYRIEVDEGATDAAGNPLDPIFGCSFTTAKPADATPPTISATDPACAATAVATNRNVAITFSEAMDPATITGTSVRLVGGSGNIAGTVSYSGRTALFTPAAALPESSSFTIDVTTAVEDTSGNALAAPFSCSFTTGTTTDTTPPSVSAVDPNCAATAVAVNSAVIISFSETMDPATLAAAIRVRDPAGVAVPGTIESSGQMAWFTPERDLERSTTYTVSVSAAAEDLAGNALSPVFSCSFTTGTTADQTPPTVSARTPECDAVSVAPNTRISIGFSKPMVPSTVTTDSFTVVSGGTPTAGSVGCDSCFNATFTPSARLVPSTQYTVTLREGIRDISGNDLGGDSVCVFTTGTTDDDTAPTLASTTPAASATGVCRRPTLSVVLDEPLDPLTLTGASFRLVGPGATAIAGTVSYDLATRTARFVPNADLADNTEFTASLSPAVQDLAGNALGAGAAAPNPWTFTTGSVACP